MLKRANSDIQPRLCRSKSKASLVRRNTTGAAAAVPVEVRSPFSESRFINARAAAAQAFRQLEAGQCAAELSRPDHLRRSKSVATVHRDRMEGSFLSRGTIRKADEVKSSRFKDCIGITMSKPRHSHPKPPVRSAPAAPVMPMPVSKCTTPVASSVVTKDRISPVKSKSEAPILDLMVPVSDRAWSLQFSDTPIPAQPSSKTSIAAECEIRNSKKGLRRKLLSSWRGSSSESRTSSSLEVEPESTANSERSKRLLSSVSSRLHLKKSRTILRPEQVSSASDPDQVTTDKANMLAVQKIRHKSSTFLQKCKNSIGPSSRVRDNEPHLQENADESSDIASKFASHSYDDAVEGSTPLYFYNGSLETDDSSPPIPPVHVYLPRRSGVPQIPGVKLRGLEPNRDITGSTRLSSWADTSTNESHERYQAFEDIPELHEFGTIPYHEHNTSTYGSKEYSPSIPERDSSKRYRIGGKPDAPRIFSALRDSNSVLRLRRKASKNKLERLRSSSQSDSSAAGTIKGSFESHNFSGPRNQLFPNHGFPFRQSNSTNIRLNSDTDQFNESSDQVTPIPVFPAGRTVRHTGIATIENTRPVARWPIPEARSLEEFSRDNSGEWREWASAQMTNIGHRSFSKELSSVTALRPSASFNMLRSSQRGSTRIASGDHDGRASVHAPRSYGSLIVAEQAQPRYKNEHFPTLNTRRRASSVTTTSDRTDDSAKEYKNIIEEPLISPTGYSSRELADNIIEALNAMPSKASLNEKHSLSFDQSHKGRKENNPRKLNSDMWNEPSLGVQHYRGSTRYVSPVPTAKSRPRIFRSRIPLAESSKNERVVQQDQPAAHRHSPSATEGFGSPGRRPGSSPRAVGRAEGIENTPPSGGQRMADEFLNRRGIGGKFQTPATVITSSSGRSPAFL